MLAKSGQVEQARTATEFAIIAVQAIIDDPDKAQALTDVASKVTLMGQALAEAGQLEQAAAAAEQALTAAETFTSDSKRPRR